MYWVKSLFPVIRCACWRAWMVGRRFVCCRVRVFGSLLLRQVASMTSLRRDSDRGWDRASPGIFFLIVRLRVRCTVRQLQGPRRRRFRRELGVAAGRQTIEPPVKALQSEPYGKCY